MSGLEWILLAIPTLAAAKKRGKYRRKLIHGLVVWIVEIVLLRIFIAPIFAYFSLNWYVLTPLFFACIGANAKLTIGPARPNQGNTSRSLSS